MLKTMNRQRDTIAMEAFLSNNLPGLLKDIFPAMVTGFTNFTSQFAPSEPAIALTSKQSEFMKELSKHSYLDIAPLTAYVPEGLSVKYLDYATFLLEAVNHIAHIGTVTLPAYSTFLSQVISNTDQKFSTTSFERTYSEMDSKRKILNLDLGVCFKQGSTKTDVTIGDVVSRNSDWPMVFKTTENITHVINSVDRKALHKKISECAELLTVIMNKIKRNEFEGVSPQLVKNLSDGAYQMASELEMYASLHYKALTYVESVNRTIARFKEIFSQK